MIITGQNNGIEYVSKKEDIFMMKKKLLATLL